MHRPNRERAAQAKKAIKKIANREQKGELSMTQALILESVAQNIRMRARRGITNDLMPVLLPRHELLEIAAHQSKTNRALQRGEF